MSSGHTGVARGVCTVSSAEEHEGLARASRTRMRRALVRWLPQVPSSALAARRLSTAATAAAHFPFPQPQLAPRSRRTPPRRSSATAAAMSSPAAPAAAVAAANEVPTASVAASSSPAAASSSSASSSPPPLWSLAPNPCAHVTSALTRIVPLQFDQPRKPVRYEDGSVATNQNSTELSTGGNFGTRRTDSNSPALWLGKCATRARAVEGDPCECDATVFMVAHLIRCADCSS